MSDELIVAGTQMGGNWHSCIPVPSLPVQEDVSTRSIRGKLNPPWVKFLREGWTSEPRQEARVSFPPGTHAVFLKDLIPDLSCLPLCEKENTSSRTCHQEGDVVDLDSPERGQEQGAKVSGRGRSLWSRSCRMAKDAANSTRGRAPPQASCPSSSLHPRGAPPEAGARSEGPGRRS